MCLSLKPNDSSSQYFSIGVLINMASIKSKLSLHKEALTHALKAFTMLESSQNQCLKSICYYTIGLEYEFLSQYSFAMQYFSEGWSYSNQFFGGDHEITGLLKNAIKTCKSKAEGMVDQYCILRENTTSLRGRSGMDIRSRDHTQKADYYIKVDTTPWIEPDNWKFKTTSQTPTLKMSTNLRKKFTRLSEDMNKSVNVPFKLEEKLNFIGKKLATLNGKLNTIERLFTDSPKNKIKTVSIGTKIHAAVVIQRAFRKHLRRKYKYSSKAIDNRMVNYSNLKVIPFFMVQNSNNSKTAKRSTKRFEKYIQTSQQGNRPQKYKSKGLLQTIIFLQKHIRGFLTRKTYKSTKLKIVKIQRVFKMYQVRKMFKNIRNAIIFIQQHFRAYLSKSSHA